MKSIKHLACISILFSIILSFNTFAMPKNQNSNEPIIPTPFLDEGYSNGDRWTWLSDDLCVQFNNSSKVTDSKGCKEAFQSRYDLGLTICWGVEGKIKKRDVYTGIWLQSEDGTRMFIFDDCTIPVEMARIDGILYAFNTLGELQEGYNYWGELKTAADGLVTSDDPEFLAWLATQYVPECTSHE